MDDKLTTTDHFVEHVQLNSLNTKQEVQHQQRGDVSVGVGNWKEDWDPIDSAVESI